MKTRRSTAARGPERIPRRKKGHVAWADAVKRGTLAQAAAADAVEAARALQALPLIDRLALVREIVQTRRVELCLAYPNVIAVSSGFKRQRRRTKGPHRVTREPCVKFLVRKKWDDEGADHGGGIPKYLFTHWTTTRGRRVIRGRQLYAVPTDVEDSRERAKARPQAPRTVIARVADGPGIDGVVTCGITRSTDTKTPYALGCEHVFSPSRSSAGGFQPARVVRKGSATLIATTVNVAGDLSDVAQHSLDGQLAAAESREALGVALGSLDLEDYARSVDEAQMAAELWIVTPRGPIGAAITQVFGEEHPIDYGHGGSVEDIHFECLMELQTTRPTRQGESGSPLCTRKDGGVLVGMLIAGPPNSVDPDASDTLSYALPAWHLMDPNRYPGAEGERWTLLPQL